jgi:hypothetical protein
VPDSVKWKEFLQANNRSLRASLPRKVVCTAKNYIPLLFIENIVIHFDGFIFVA